MPRGLIELGQIMMAAAQRRLEMVSQNISNVSTPGFKAQVRLQEALSAANVEAQTSPEYTNLAQGGLTTTGRAFDLALSGPGFFVVRGEAGFFYTRDGQFERGADGRVVNTSGYVLQSAEGSDLVVRDYDAEIANDGTVLEDGLPIAHIAVMAPANEGALQSLGGSIFVADADNMQSVEAPVVRRGMLEASNVDAPSEMLQMMASMRQAEAGARVVQAYDSLIGQAISTLGRTQR